LNRVIQREFVLPSGGVEVLYLVAIIVGQNTTKHHEISASFDGEQLANDFDTLVPLLVKTIENIIANRK
jgi:hypothetical protein